MFWKLALVPRPPPPARPRLEQNGRGEGEARVDAEIDGGQTNCTRLEGVIVSDSGFDAVLYGSNIRYIPITSQKDFVVFLYW